MAKLTPFPDAQVFDDNGDPLSGGKVYTYEAGTATNKTTYTDASEDTAHANPVILDSEGRGEIWLGEGSYKIRVFDSSDNLIDERDDIIGDTSASFLGSTYSLSSNTTITSAYQNSLISVTAAATLSLLAAADAGDGFSFAVKNDGSGTVTIDPNLSETVNGSATVVLQSGDSAIITCDGTNWLMVGGVSVEGMTFAGDVKFTGKVQFADDGELTISTGAVTITGVSHTIDTESDAASDDLDTINGGADGDVIIVRPEHTDRTVVLKHGTGNIRTSDGSDVTLDSTDKAAILQYNLALTAWLVIASPVTLLDEDDMSSDSDTAAPTQQSVKAYTDSKAGKVKQRVYASVATTSSGTAQIPYDDTIPQNTEGIEAITAAITPTNSSNILRITGFVNASYSATNGIMIAALFQDSTASALQAGCIPSVNVNDMATVPIKYEMVAGTTSETTFKIRVGGDVSSTVYLNSNSGGRKFGGILAHTLIIEEIEP